MMKRSFIGTLLGGAVISSFALLAQPDDAQAYMCVTGYQRLTPPCCPSPCPVIDNATKDFWKDIIASQEEWDEVVSGSEEAPQSTPVEEGSPEATSLIEAYRQLKMAHDKDTGSNIPVKAIDPDIQFPDFSLNVSDLPGIRAKSQSTMAGYESIENAKTRIFEYFVPTGLPTITNLNAIQSKRQRTLRKVAANAYARSLVKKYEMPDQLKSLQKYKRNLRKPTSWPQDIKTNSNLRMAVGSKQAEINELLNIYAELLAAKKSIENLPMIQEGESETLQYSMSDATANLLSTTEDFRLSYEAFHEEAMNSVKYHNILVEIYALEDEIANLDQYIVKHDVAREHFWLIYNEMYDYLGALYEDPYYALEKLVSILAQYDTTTYFSANKYTQAFDVTKQVSIWLLDQAQTTIFGRRKRNPECSSSSNSQEQECPEFEPGITIENMQSGTPAIQTINSYYAGTEDAYRVISGETNQSGSEEDEASPSAFILMGQYYLEARKRKDYWGELRHGKAPNTTSDRFRSEITQKFPSCMYGPLEATSDNILSYPDWFEVDPACSYRKWSGNLENISHEELGGVDQSIWLAQNLINEYREVYPELENNLSSSVSNANSILINENLVARASEMGMVDTVEKIKKLILYIQAVEADPQCTVPVQTSASVASD